MHPIPPFLKPFLRLLELAVVVFVVYKLAAYSIEAEEAAMAEHTNWREQIGIGLAQTFLAAIIIFIYFLFWNARIIDAIKKEKQRIAKYLNIGLILLFPGIFGLTLLYWKIEKKIVKHQSKSFLALVSYREIYHTPNNLTSILGFRPAPDSLLILTNKLKNVAPPTVYRNGKEVPAIGVYQEVIENSEELFSLKNGQLKRIETQQTYNQFYEFYFKGWAKCLQAFFKPENAEKVYRFNNCTQKHLHEPYLTGYSPNFRHSTIINYEVGPELFFITQPLYSDFQTDKHYYIGRINDTDAKVYQIDLSKNQELMKEFKNSFSHPELFATSRHIYLVSRFRVLEINI